jgi:hypothetical protein
MKKQLVARIKLYGKSLFFTTVTVLLINISANAQSLDSKASIAENVSVTHVQSKDASSLFHVRIPNEAGDRFSLTIKDANGGILFNNIYNDKEFDRKFLITDIESDAKLLFTISSLKTRKTQTFETTAVSRIIDDVVVTRLK